MPGTRREDEDDLVALLEALDCVPAHVAGNSSGATIALGLAARRPDAFRSLTAHEPPLAGDREKCRALIAKSTEAGAKKSAHDSGSFFGRRLLVGAHPVAAAADVDDSGVPQQAVDDGRGDDRIGKDLAPVREATV